MKTWRGMAADMAAVSDGAQMIRNCSFRIGGEFTRRPTLQISMTTAGTLGTALYGAPNGTQYVMQVTSDGTVKVLATE